MSKYLRIQRRLSRSHCLDVIRDAVTKSFAVFPADVREVAHGGGWGFFALGGSAELMSQLSDAGLPVDAFVVPFLKLDDGRKIAADSGCEIWIWSRRRAWVLIDQHTAKVTLRGAIAIPPERDVSFAEPRRIWQCDHGPHRQETWWYSVDLDRSRPPANVPMTGITTEPESPGWYDALLPVRSASSICIGCHFDSKNCSLKSDVSRSHRCRLRTPPLPNARDSGPGGGDVG